jgi:hypothetical protein
MIEQIFRIPLRPSFIFRDFTTKAKHYLALLGLFYGSKSSTEVDVADVAAAVLQCIPPRQIQHHKAEYRHPVLKPFPFFSLPHRRPSSL